MTFTSIQTVTARAALRDADGAVRQHKQHCAHCRTARFEVDYCEAGWGLVQDAAAARRVARRSAELDAQVPAGQEPMF